MPDLYKRYGDVEIEFLGVKFRPRPDVNYFSDYVALWKHLRKSDEMEQIKKLQGFILYDLWFLCYFVICGKDEGKRDKINDAKGWFVDRAKEVKDHHETYTLDLWGRGHGKSLLLNTGKTVQYHLIYPEHCTLILSFKKSQAEAFQKSIMEVYSDPRMVKLFPMRLYDNPATQSPSWGAEKGATIKRENRSRPQNTIQSSGLVEGMLTGGRFERLLFDDVVTLDTCTNIDAMNKCFDAFQIALNLGTMSDSDIVNVVGTYYHHLDPLTRIKDMVYGDGKPLFNERKKPTTHDGTRTGKPVMVSDKYLEILKSRDDFNTQHLLDPTPKGEQVLNGDKVQDIEYKFIPKKGVAVFMMVDPAGDDKDGCDWAMAKVVVEPNFDNISLSKRYIVDYYADTMGHTEAINAICDMFLRGEFVNQLGIEDDRSMTHKFVMDMLQSRGRRVSEDMKNFVYLKHRGRNKDNRIASAWQMPLLNDKWFISKTVPASFRDKLRTELNHHPHGVKDSIDCLAYLPDMIGDYVFGSGRRKKRSYKVRCADSMTGY